MTFQAHTSRCEYLKVPCPHQICGIMVKKSDLAEHLQSECVCRSVKCSYCGKDITANKTEVSSRSSQYNSKTTVCTSCCLKICTILNTYNCTCTSGKFLLMLPEAKMWKHCAGLISSFVLMHMYMIYVCWTMLFFPTVQILASVAI